MKYLLFVFLFYIPANFCVAQVDLDLYSTNMTYKGSIKEVTARYYEPIYEDTTFIKYVLDDSPTMYRINFDQNGRKLLREEYDTKCGIDTSCRTSITNYEYENEKLILEERTGKNINRTTYTYAGDSIVKKTTRSNFEKKYVIQFNENTKSEKGYNALGYLQSEKITRFNEYKLPQQYQRYWVGELKDTQDYTYSHTNPTLISKIVTTYHKTQNKLIKELKYNDQNHIILWQDFNKAGKLYNEYFFRYKYDHHGNWVEKIILNKQRRIKSKIVKSYLYY